MRVHLDKTKPVQTPRREAIHAWVFFLQARVAVLIKMERYLSSLGGQVE